jgi:hypothetical protein
VKLSRNPRDGTAACGAPKAIEPRDTACCFILDFMLASKDYGAGCGYFVGRRELRFSRLAQGNSYGITILFWGFGVRTLHEQVVYMYDL